MKKVIWGTGLYANKFMLSMKKEDIDFFIDNNKSKRNQLFWGKKIVHPSDIKNWKDLYIYVPFNFYEEISMQLKRNGLKEGENFSRYNEKNKILFEECKKDYQKALTDLQTNKTKLYGRTLFWGRLCISEKGYKKYLQELKKCIVNLELGVISEDIGKSAIEIEEIMEMPSVVTPKIFDIDLYVENGKLVEEKVKYIKGCPELRKTFEQIKKNFPKIQEESAFSMTYFLNSYTEKVLDELKPVRVFAEGSVNTSRRILEKKCKERNIPVIYTHAGILPGTFTFDIGGEMGKSLPTLYSEKFLKLPINDNDIEQAKKVWDYLYVSKLSRKVQPKNHCIEDVIKKISKGRPIVLFTGQLDIFSHMIPYTEETRKYHSPIFKTSIEAAVYLAEICKLNDWNYIYKPHPMYIRPEEIIKLPSNTIYVEFGDINDLIDISDVIVTIVSQTSYIGLLRNKPVVTLGYSQIKGKGCAYEVYEKKKIKEIISVALEDGFTLQQKKAFLNHIAQILKYYVYDDLREREIRFGRSVPCSIDEFYELDKLLKQIVCE